jgi:hypothetical protein
VDTYAPEIDMEGINYYAEIKATTIEMPFLFAYDDSPFTITLQYGTSTSYGYTGTITNTHTESETEWEYKEFTASMKNLTPNTTYYYKLRWYE